MAEAALVANPDLVHLLVLPGHHAFDHKLARHAGAARVEVQVAAHRAVRADRSRVDQFPRSSAEAEVARGERAHRADVSRVAGEFGVEAGFREGDDFQFAPALVETNDRVPGDFICEAGAACALDAALTVE